MKRTVLGLYLSEKIAQAVLLETATARPVLLALHNWTNTLFDYAGDDTPGVDEFMERLSHFLSNNAALVQRSSVALDGSLLSISTIPFSSGATQKTISEHIEWELNQLFPGSPKRAFITDTHVLARHHDLGYEDLLSVSVRRDVVSKLHRVLEKQGLRLDLVDVDHFSAHTALLLNYTDLASKYIALVGSKSDRVDISLVRFNEMESFSYYITSSTQMLIDQIATLSKKTDGLHSILLFGANLDEELLADIRRVSAVHVELLNPFRNVDIKNSLPNMNDPTSLSYRYAAAVGVALRES